MANTMQRFEKAPRKASQTRNYKIKSIHVDGLKPKRAYNKKAAEVLKPRTMSDTARYLVSGYEGMTQVFKAVTAAAKEGHTEFTAYLPLMDAAFKERLQTWLENYGFVAVLVDNAIMVDWKHLKGTTNV